MSQELQLSIEKSPGQGAAFPVPQGSLALGAAGGTGAPPRTALGKLHQLLRGRYLLAVVLGVLCAGTGATLGFLTPKVPMESNGLIEIKPTTLTPYDYDKIMPMYNQYVSSVVAKLHSERVMKAAMETREWRERRPATGADALAAFSRNLTVRFLPNTELVQITYTDDARDAREVAPIAVRAVIKSYRELFGDQDGADELHKIAMWDKKKLDANSGIAYCRDQIQALAKDFGDEQKMLVDSKFHSYVELQSRLEDAKTRLATAEAELKSAAEASKNNKEPEYSPEDIARVDPVMQEHLRIRSAIEMRIQELGSLGINNPAIKQSKSELDARNQMIQRCAQDVRSKYFIRWKDDGSGGTLLPRDLSHMRLAVNLLKKQFEAETNEVSDTARRSMKITDFKKEIERLEVDLAEANKHIADLGYEHEMANQMSVVQDGDTAQVANDHRPMMGALGFLFGGAFPVAMLMLVGLMNPRYRFSDEAHTELSGLSLLGILPDLPDRLSDPEQASVAAHCVHQIRTMLQLNFGNERVRAFAVTSAAPGDGKTSLTLALGLSYAACGTRTLLVDCDMVGAGLSSRMDMTAPEGVLEAIARHSLLDYVQPTDIPDVSILPVGSAQVHHASTLSPASLRRLVQEAQKHYDVILIDTGPILGSIEASLVCAAADAVVLTVSRGQQRPLVEKAMSHLSAIGARLAGVVFNRARAADFDRSISGLSLRSAAASGSGHNGRAAARRPGRVGPIVGAVQTAARPPEGNDQL